MWRLLCLCVALCACAEASAGPLLDRLRERREAQIWGEEADASAGSNLPAGARALKDLAYGSDKAQRIDVYIPVGAQHTPVIFMVHGGAWRVGDKAMARVVDNKLQHWLPRGVALVSINYPMLPAANPLQQSEDVLRALAFAQRKAPEWGADPASFVLMGHSAGAHLVALINSAPQKAAGFGVRPWLGAVSLDTAAMDIVATMQAKHYGFYDKAFGADPAFWQLTSPLQQLSVGAPPLFAVCSSVRPDHPCAQTHAFAAQARQMGLRVEVLEQALKHAEINGELGKPGAYTAAVDTFLASLAPAFARQ
jgi:acetyl esterase/lipase